MPGTLEVPGTSGKASMEKSNIVIIGGGILGLATAYNLSRRYPKQTITLLEKEDSVATHQSGHNSGVIHSGVYYKPGSYKANLCREGKQALEAFCREAGIPFETCGKVIVATDQNELEGLHQLAKRGSKNGVQCELIGRRHLRQIEPHVTGIEALLVHDTGIVDYQQVSRRLMAFVSEAGNQILTGATVTDIEERENEVIVRTAEQELHADFVVACAGLYSDRLAAMVGTRLPARIVPFRGEYYKLRPAAKHLCRNLIYPVPDARFPFLGVHFTRTIDGQVECGPNAVFAFAREGYRLGIVNRRDLLDSLSYIGFMRLVSRYWRTGMGEMWRSLSKQAFAGSLRRLIPDITADDLISAPAGVRAQAIAPDGRLLYDFAFHETPRTVHVINAPSPAATASLSIGRQVVERLSTRFI